MIAHAIRSKIIWSTFVQYGGKLLQAALGVLIVKTISSSLGAADYGIYGKITEYSLFFATVAGLGIFGNTVRALSDEPENGEIYWNALTVRVLSAAAVLAVGLTYAQVTIPDPFFRAGVLVFMGSLFIDFINSVNAAAFQANYWMGRFTLIQISGRILEWILVSHFSQTAPDGLHFFLAQVANATWSLTLATILISTKLKLKLQLNFTLLKTLFLGSLPLGIINIVNNLYYRFLPSYFLSQLFSDAEYGRYSLLLTICGQLALLSTLLMFSTLPILKSSLDEGHGRRVHELLNKTGKLLGGLGVLMVVSGSILGPHLIGLISSSDFKGAELGVILPIMLSITAISWLYDFVLIGLFALNQESWFLKQELIALAIGFIGMSFAASPLLVLTSALAALSFSVFQGLRRIKTSFPKPAPSAKT